MIKYLIKFVSQKSYADMLVAGKLFMRPASYYHNLEKGQGDIREAWIIPSVQMYLNANIPIMCFYAVDEAEVADGKIIVSAKCIEDFKCQNGYAVIIDFTRFEDRLEALDTNGYMCFGGAIKYRLPELSELEQFFKSDRYANLFIKHPYYAYQKEYRIVIGKSVYHGTDAKKADSVIYQLPKNIKEICRVDKISIHLSPDGNYTFPILN